MIPHPETEQLFERLLRAMAKQVFGKRKEEEDRTLDAERDEGCGDTTPTDTSEDAS